MTSDSIAINAINFLPPKFRSMFNQDAPLIGSGSFADVWPLGSDFALRLCHRGYNPYKRGADLINGVLKSSRGDTMRADNTRIGACNSPMP